MKLNPPFISRLSAFALPMTVMVAMCLTLMACGKKAPEPSAASIAAAEAAPISVDKVVGIATIEPLNRILPLNCEVSGTVNEILVKATEHATKGQVILTLSSDVERAQVAQAQSKIATQRDVIKAAEATVGSLRVKLANARTTYERNQKLAAGNALPQSTADDSKFAVDGYEKDIVASEANIAQAKSRLSELETDLKYFQTVLERRKVSAPASGIILNLEAKIGSNVTATSSVGDFAPDGPIMAVTEIDELFADKIQMGQTGYIRLQGSTEKIAGGKVVYLAPYLKKKSLFSDRADNLEDRRVREVRLELEPGAKVLIGSRVECVISPEQLAESD